MPNIFHQSVEDILRAATPEQKILWNYLFLRFGERIAISQFCFTGQFAGTEIATYTARKLYVAYQLTLAYYLSSANLPVAFLYDETNSSHLELSGNIAYWDATAGAVRYTSQSNQFNNLWFSRINSAQYQRIHFVGYRITY